MTNSLYKYLRCMATARIRSEILKLALAKGFTRGRMNTENRTVLQDAIFTVENELEHEVGELQPGKGGKVIEKRREWVKQMRGVRNAIMDDLGWNEAGQMRKAVTA